LQQLRLHRRRTKQDAADRTKQACDCSTEHKYKLM
jgi:hypothetical protein